MAIPNASDLTHVVRSTRQWETTYDKSETIPLGVLCVEFTTKGTTLIKIGDGHHKYADLPYISGNNIDLSNYYTKNEVDAKIPDNIVTIKGVVNDKTHIPKTGKNGDLWFVENKDKDGNKIYDHHIWYNGEWRYCKSTSGDVDIREYVEQIINEFIDVLRKAGELHTHKNKEILDNTTASYTKEEKEKLKTLKNYDDTELRDLIKNIVTHYHANKDILDKITAAFTKEYEDKLNSLENYDDTAIFKAIDELQKLAHSHENKDILDKTTAVFTEEYESLMKWIRKYTGATMNDDGIMGLVPPAERGQEDYVLSGSGEWIPMDISDPYELPIATDEILGGVKIGDGIDISEDGTISVKLDITWVTEGDAIEVVKKPIPGNKTIDILQECTTWSHQEYSMVTSADYSSAAPGVLSTARVNNSTGYMILPSDHTRFIVDVKAKNGKALKVRMSNMSDTTATHFDIIRIDHGHRSDIKYFDPGEIMSPSYTYEGASFNRYHRYMLTIRWAENKDLINTPLNPSDLEYFTITYLDEDYENPIGTENVVNVKYGDGLSLDEEGKLKVDFPIATTETLGGVIVGDGLVIDENGVISVDESIKHPPIKAGIGIDITQDEETKEDIISVKYSSGLNINEDNELFVDGKEDTIPRFTKEEYEQAVIDGTAPPPGSLFIITDDEEEPDPPEYELPIASDEVLGGIRVGEGLIIDENGVLSVGNIHASQVDMKDYRPADEYTPITESDNVSTAIGKLDVGLISKEDKIPRFTKEEYEQAVLDGTAPKPGELFIITDDINPLDPYGVIDVKTTENEVGKLDIIKNAETKTIDIFEYLESLTLNCVTDDSSI